MTTTTHRRPSARCDLMGMIGLAIAVAASLALGFLIGVLASDLPLPTPPTDTIICGKEESDCRVDHRIVDGVGQWSVTFDPN